MHDNFFTVMALLENLEYPWDLLTLPVDQSVKVEFMLEVIRRLDDLSSSWESKDTVCHQGKV